MYNIHLYDYVPAPKPVTTDRIVAAHYYPSWSKGQNHYHAGFDGLHDFPERTPLIGYYDGDLPENMDWEIKWALEHGINCFIYCWYRKKENFGKPVTTQALRLGRGLHEGFFGARYQSMMQFAIMFEAQAAWCGTDERDLLENLMPFWIKEYFCRENYLKIDNKPVLFIYDCGEQVQNAFATPELQKKAFDACRAMAREHGFDGMIFATEYRGNKPERFEQAAARGYDFSFAYCWGMSGLVAPSDEEVLAAQEAKMALRATQYPTSSVLTAACMWDPEPRMVSMPETYPREKNLFAYRLRPESFRILLERMKALSDGLPEDSFGRRLVMLDNWNEWDEGHYLLPSYEFGFGFLQAVREVFTARDNLPDYRLPAQLGTASVNTCWEEPDLSAYNTEAVRRRMKN